MGFLLSYYCHFWRATRSLLQYTTQDMSVTHAAACYWSQQSTNLAIWTINGFVSDLGDVSKILNCRSPASGVQPSMQNFQRRHEC